MNQIKSKRNIFKEFPVKINRIIIQKMPISIISILIALLFTNSVFSQNKNDTSASASSSNGDDTFNQMLDYSRPGKYHQLLDDLPGTWTYKGGHSDSSGNIGNAYYGTFVWKPFANGRFFIADVTSSKIQMPVQDGKTIETDYKAIYTLGYNNVKKRFEETTITNMIGSDISFIEGDYDSTAKAIIFNFVDKPIPSMNVLSRLVFRFIDKDHYVLEYYDEEDGKYVKNNEVQCTRTKKK